MQSLNRLVAVVIALLSGLIILSACQTPTATPTQPARSESAGIPEYVIRAVDYAFEAPLEIPAGQVYIRLENDGREIHHVQLLRLNDGVTLEQFQAALQTGEDAAFPLVTFTGGVGALGTEGQGRVLLDLAEGQYVLACFMPSPDGVPHLAKGMLAPIKVFKLSSQTTAEKPTPSVTATLKDFTIDLAGEIKPGKQLWQISNAGPQPHELTLLRLAQGKTIEDLSAFLASPSGEPPFEWSGGMQALSAGQTGWLDLDLTPGNYVVVCNVPDPASGHAHAELGMILPFSVREGAPVDASLTETELDAFAAALTQSVTEHDYDQLHRMMGDHFNVINWLADGMQYTPDEAAAQAREVYLPAGSAAQIHLDADLVKILGGLDPLAFLNTETSQTVKALFATGLGEDGTDEAVFFIGRRADGGVFWSGLLFAAGGFAGQPTPAHPELFTVQDSEIEFVMAMEDVDMRAGPSDGYEVIGQVFGGQTAKVTGVSVDGNWWRVICPDDTTGDCFIPLGSQVEAVTSN